MTPQAKSGQTNYTPHNESKPLNQNEPSSILKVPALNQPINGTLQEVPLFPLFWKPPYLSLISSSKYVPKYKRKGWCRRDPRVPHTQYRLVGPRRNSPSRYTPHTPPLSRNLQTPSRANPKSPLEPPKPGPHLQPLRVPGRVTSSSNTDSIMDTEAVEALMSVAAAPLVPPWSLSARIPRSPPTSIQLLFGLWRRRWNSNRSHRHVSRRFFLRK